MANGDRFLEEPVERITDKDAALLEAVNEALALDPRTTGTVIVVQVRNGIVTLRGVATQDVTRDAAAEVAAQVPGVDHVHNNVSLRQPVMGA